MRFRTTVALGALLIGAAACTDTPQNTPVAPQASLIEPQGKPSSHLYVMVRTHKSESGWFWAQANAAALALRWHGKEGFHLVTIADATENATVLAITGDYSCWIGVKANGSSWVSYDGSAQTYSNWSVGTPTPVAGSGAYIVSSGMWAAASSNTGVGCYVAELDPPV